ncbi:MAG TPA: hypothetical protein VGX68_22480 [Thermoanaerobaculia bacterium]|jgi:hypothetical protein|nr:hypothetical protein [Thermoanaerobaculia bacterium]
MNRKKLVLLVLALAAFVGALASAPAAANHRCGFVCTAPDCCVYCCIEWPCPPPICDVE